MLIWRIETDTAFQPQGLVLRLASEAWEHDPALLKTLLEGHPDFLVPSSAMGQACAWPISGGVKLHHRVNQTTPVPIFLANSPGDVEIGLAAGCKQLAMPALYSPPAARPSNTTMYSLVLQVLSSIVEEEPPENIEKLVRTDPALWVRLLRYFNSPAVGPAREVVNLRQGLSLVGYRGLSRWFALSLVTAQIDLPGPLRCAALRALVRAYLNEALASSTSVHRGAANQAFMLGLLSELPALTGLSVDDLVRQLKLPPTIMLILTSSPEHSIERPDPLGIIHALSLGTETTNQESRWLRMMDKTRLILRLDQAPGYVKERDSLSQLTLGALSSAWQALFPTT